VSDTFRPARGLDRRRPYAVPRHPAPVDLRLDGNEGRAPDPDAFDTARALEASRLRGYPSPAELEARLAEMHGLEAERVLATCGADDALLRACTAALEPGREAVVPVPTFEMLPRYVELAGGTLRAVPWPEGPYPLEAVLAAAGPATRLIAVVSPNNPTGAVAGAEDLERLARAVPGALLVVDLAYVELADEDLTAAALALPNAVVTRTLSKAWGLAGLRVGYALGPAELIGWLRAAGNPYAVSGPSSALAVDWLEKGGAFARAYVERVRAEREELGGALARLGARPLPSQANFVLARFDPPARAVWVHDALAGLGIGVRAFPGREHLGDALRITCPGGAEDQARLIAGLEVALDPEALLFDLDGVLADVSRSYRGAILATAAAYGVEVGPGEIAAAKARGNANDDWALTRDLLAAHGTEAPLEEVTERFERIYQGDGGEPGLRSHETLVPERALLERLAARMPLAVVTGRPRADAERFLAEAGIAELFRAVVCREDAPLKPDPGPVRVALERLGVRRAWLVGDSPDDVRAARRAGVVPVGIPPAGTDEDAGPSLLAAGAARVLDTLDQLEEVLP
jgi:histidinol-phosphate aminotransferase